MTRTRSLERHQAGSREAERTLLGLSGDLDDVELVQDVEQAFRVRLPDDELSRCHTVGDLFELVAARLPSRANADRCATAMCFYRLRRAVLALAPDVQLHPSTPIEVLQGIPVKSLYRSIEGVGGLRPPLPYISVWGGFSLLLAVAAPIGLLLCGAPWWAAVLAVPVAITAYRFSPVRLPPQVKIVRDLVECVAARSVATLADQGARLRPAEAWKALQTVCADHAATPAGEIGSSTLLYASRKTAK
jgi:hypothetical protein